MWIRTFENNEEALLNITNIRKIVKRNNRAKTWGSDIFRVDYQIIIFSEDSNGSELITTICFLTEKDRNSGFDMIRCSKEVMGGLSKDVDLTGLGAYSEEEWQ